MKTYMNRIDREHHVMILVLWDYLNTWLEQTSCLSKEERKRIKTAATHLLHTSDSIVQRLEPDYAKRLLRAANNTEVRVVDKINQGLRREPDTINININDLYDLAGFSLKECAGCKKENHKECDRYQLFMKLDIPVAQEQTEGCPYEN